ncbi:MAG: ribokinase [Vicinamibacteraceae bacterium]
MAKVVVVGSTNTDMTVRVSRLPSPGETVTGGDFRVTGGGKGANQAVAAARAGAPVVFVTALGTDDIGDRAVANLAAEGIDVRFVRRIPGAASGIALILVDAAGENVIAVASGANAELQPGDLAALETIVEPGDVVLVQLEIALATVQAAATLARRRQARLILNPAPAQPLPDALLATVGLLTPNEHEVAALTGLEGGAVGAWPTIARSLHDRGVPEVVITLGAAGAFVSGPGGAAHLPAFAVDAVDTTAAGDVFNGALAVALIEGRSTIDAARFASAAAAISVTRHGARASAPHRAEIDAWLQLQPSPTASS